jgi:hypothetical protein
MVPVLLMVTGTDTTSAVPPVPPVPPFPEPPPPLPGEPLVGKAATTAPAPPAPGAPCVPVEPVPPVEPLIVLALLNVTPAGKAPLMVSAALPVMAAVLVATTGELWSHPAATARVRRLRLEPPAKEKLNAPAAPPARTLWIAAISSAHRRKLPLRWRC